MLTFAPVEPRRTLGFRLQSLQIHIRDHKRRDLPVGERSLEAYYGGFVFSQSRSTVEDARRRALETSYGPSPVKIDVSGHEGRSYELGPEREADYPDPRMPAVVTWSDGDRFFLVASDELEAGRLVEIARSVYDRR